MSYNVELLEYAWFHIFCCRVINLYLFVFILFSCDASLIFWFRAWRSFAEHVSASHCWPQIMMEAKLKVSCWCCEKCVSSRRQKVCQSGDDHEVFLPLSSMIESESNSESTGSIKTDSSRISSQTSPQCGFGRSDGFNVDMSINTSILVGNNKGVKVNCSIASM